MAATKEIVVNEALGLLNVSPIVSFNDGSDQANLANNHYDDLRDAVLEDGDWTFAMGRSDLIATTGYSAEFPEWANSFDLPADCIRVVAINQEQGRNKSFNNEKHWVREGNVILTNYSVAHCRYIKQITDTTLFSPGFTQALVARIAWVWAIPLTKSKTLRDLYKADYVDLINNAELLDGQQGTPENTGRGRLVDARSRMGKSQAGPTV